MDGEAFHSLADLPEVSYAHCLTIVDEDKMAVTAAKPDSKAVCIPKTHCERD